VKPMTLLLLLITCFADMAKAGGAKTKPEAVVVKVLSLELPHDEDKRSQFLWHNFANQPEENQFNSYTTEKWTDNFNLFAAILVHKAERMKLDSHSLRKVLDLVFKDSKKKIAYLPVGAYQTTLDGHLVWIITVKWEYPPQEGSEELGHIRMFAFDQKTLKQVGFETCM